MNVFYVHITIPFQSINNSNHHKIFKPVPTPLLLCFSFLSFPSINQQSSISIFSSATIIKSPANSQSNHHSNSPITAGLQPAQIFSPVNPALPSPVFISKAQSKPASSSMLPASSLSIPICQTAVPQATDAAKPPSAPQHTHRRRLLRCFRRDSTIIAG